MSRRPDSGRRAMMLVVGLCLASTACSETRRDRTPAWYFPDAEPPACIADECEVLDDAGIAEDAALAADPAGDPGPLTDADAARGDALADTADAADCAEGYQWHAERGVCQDTDECAVDNGGCGDAKFFACANRPGPVPECADIDECQQSDACGGYACTNLVGAAPRCAVNCPDDSDDARGDGSLCLARVKQLTGTYYYQCALLGDESLRCWGRIKPSWEWPTQKFSQVSAANRQVCGLTQDEVQCWYVASSAMKLWAQDPATNVRELVTLDYESGRYLLLHHDGTLTGADQSLPAGVTYRDVASSGARHCAVESSGKLVCWGFWGESFLARIAALPERDFRAVSVGALHACALREGGTLRCYGEEPREGQTEGLEITGPNADVAGDFVQLGAGTRHTCALTRSGQIRCWGRELRDEVSGPAMSPLRFTRITLDEERTCAFTERDAMRCWGSGLGLLRHANAAPTQALTQSGCAVRNDGSLGCPEADFPGASAPLELRESGARDYVPVSNGLCALGSDGRLMCWRYGQPAFPVDGSQDERFQSLLTDRSVVCGVRDDQSVRCFSLQYASSLRPLEQLGADAGPYRAIAQGYGHVCALRDSGRLSCWGPEDSAVSGPNASSDTYRAVAAGDGVTCAISNAGGIRCWRNEQTVDFPQPSFPRDFTQIAMSFDRLYGLRKNGSIYAYAPTGAPISSGFEWLSQRFTQLKANDQGACALTTSGAVVCRGAVYVDGDALVQASRPR